MSEKKLRALIGDVIDQSKDRVITASSIAGEAHKKLPSVPLDRLRQIAAEELRDKFENPASFTPEHRAALLEYGRRKGFVRDKP